MEVVNVEEFLGRMEETNERILRALEALREQPRAKEGLRKVRVAREYFCDAVLLALEKRLDEGEKKLRKAVEVLKEVE